jgi:hypothetical protein
MFQNLLTVVEMPLSNYRWPICDGTTIIFGVKEIKLSEIRLCYFKL